MNGILLDPITGRPAELRPPIDDVIELAALEQPDWKRRLSRLMVSDRPQAADGIYYVDSKAPFAVADQGAVTLAATSKQLWPTVNETPTSGGGYWWPGKKVRLRVYGKITTGATPGNLTLDIRYGTTDAGGTQLATSAAVTLIASQTNIPFHIDAYITCRGIGVSGSGGSFLAWGVAQFGAAVIATTAQPIFIPASAPAAVNADTTVSSGLHIGAARSGSTAETMTAVDVIFQAFN